MEVSGQLHAPSVLPQGKSPSYPLDRRVGEPQSRSGHGCEEKNSQLLQGLELPNIQPIDLHYFFFPLVSTVLIGPWPSLMDFPIHRHFGRTPWLGDQSNTRPLTKHRTIQHRNTQTHIHAPSKIRNWDVNVQAVVDSTCLRPLGY
jgi:hypothetical protein